MADISEKTIADELREAAARVREAVTGTSGTPWRTRTAGYDDGTAVVAVGGRLTDGFDTADARWITLVSPALAEPLAAWLEKAAARAVEDIYLDDIGCTDEDQCEFQCGGHEEKPICDRCGHQVGQDAPEGCRCACWDAALAVARVLNGTAPQEVFAR